MQRFLALPVAVLGFAAVGLTGVFGGMVIGTVIRWYVKGGPFADNVVAVFGALTLPG